MGIKYKDKSHTNLHRYFGFHKVLGGWICREWAPDAKEMYLTGDFNRWDRRSHPMTRKEKGIFEIFLSGEDSLFPGCRVLEVVCREGFEEDRVPL